MAERIIDPTTSCSKFFPMLHIGNYDDYYDGTNDNKGNNNNSFVMGSFWSKILALFLLFLILLFIKITQ
jgi:hypothetical protein